MFQYYGNVEEMTRFLERNRDSFRRAYSGVLGRKMFEQVERAEEELITPLSFFDIHELTEYGIKIRSGHSKFMTLFLSKESQKLDLANDGHFKLSDESLRVAPGFAFNREGFLLNKEHYAGWASPYAAGYVHEYDHFVIYALQKRSLMAAIMLLLDKLNPAFWPLDFLEIEMQANEVGGDLKTRQVACYLGIFALQLHQLYEFSTRQIDKEVFKRLGYRVPEGYSVSEPRQYGLVSFSTLNMKVLLPLRGDALYGCSIKDRLKTLADWEQKFSSGMVYQENFMESFMGLSIEKTPINKEVREGVMEQFKKIEEVMGEE